MAKKRKSQFKLPKKTCWHLYSLQGLCAKKFVEVVERVRKGEFLIIK